MEKQKQTHARVSEIAARYGMSETTVRTWCKNHDLAIRIRHSILVDIEKFDQFFNAYKKGIEAEKYYETQTKKD